MVKIFSRCSSNSSVNEFRSCVENPWPQIKLRGVEAGLEARIETPMTGELPGTESPSQQTETLLAIADV
jgi:hypothetical protein